LIHQTKLLFRLLWQPVAAMGEILDRGSLLYASLAALVAMLVLTTGLDVRLPLSFYTPLLILAGVYVPGLVLLATLFGGLGSPGAVFPRDYSPLLTCVAMAFSAALVPLILAAWTAPLSVFLLIAACAAVYFLVLVFLAVRTVFGVENGTAAAVTALSWIPLVAVVFLWGPLSMLLHLVASPFFLLYAVYFLGGELRNLGGGLRSRQHFRRMLEAAAVNPHDGEAQYQLGLIHQQRRQYTEAIQRFQAAIAIDPTETDAHFQLGRIARQQDRLTDALAHFQTVLQQDEKHSQSEIHRELGAVLLSLGRPAEARRELAVYIDRRPYDPEGLFYLGQALEQLGQIAQAREMYAASVEAVRTAPRYRRRIVARWSRLAQKQSAKLPANTV
jgi:Flp pilus assembly protein TadD